MKGQVMLKQWMTMAAVAALTSVGFAGREKVKTALFEAADYGIAPGKTFVAADVERLLADVKASKADRKRIVFQPGVYDIGTEQCQTRTWFISNHDQVNPRKVFLPLEDQQNVAVAGKGAFFNLRGRILPMGIWNSKNVRVKDVTVDYETPIITQVTFTAVDPTAQTVTFKPIAGSYPELDASGRLYFKGYDFRKSSGGGILFEADGRIAYKTSDIGFNLGKVTDNGDGSFTAAQCAHPAFKAGQHLALRVWERPAPGFVISDSEDVTLKNVTVHYADGMGLLCQSTKDITLDTFKVVPNKAKGRFFSTQADATHFSGCWGEIVSKDGVYQGMMDDAINVHGTYLRVQKRIDDKTLECAYMHPQAYGFSWGTPGEKVIFIKSREMAMMYDTENSLDSITPVDQPTIDGAKLFRLTFKNALPETVDPTQVALGIENLSRTPSVVFDGNIVMDNRARGALFSTPQKVVCTNNIFDHISGSGILLCGDCNGWYETGACTDVLIAENTFVNTLTSPFQFTEAVISICPEIPEIKEDSPYLHRNITIKDNVFAAFDKPLVFAKSVDGLVIKDNTFVKTDTYAPYHWHQQWLTLRHCKNVDAEAPRGWKE
ncbi:MAG: alpha-1,3-galactosidase B [Kiritimatiellae bacterium]|nr:alpha-1,3-galactosidase B [Kiritimatiellia bacterium]